MKKEYNIHKDMTLSHYQMHMEITYDEFIEKFNKKKWYMHKDFSRSLFSEIDKTAIHARMIVFDGSSYLALSWFEYWRICRFVKRYIKKNFDKIEKKDVFS